MKKKILIGSIVAVVILVLVSFTGVVGYQTTKSSSIDRVSPLFNVRTNRAIDRDSKDLTCKYVGKGITLPFPERDDKTIMVQKVVDSIRIMGDKTFERFIASLINHVPKGDRFNGVKPDEIREALYQLRNSDKPILIFDVDANHNLFTVGQTCVATCMCPITSGHGIKGIIFCFIFIPLLIIFDSLLFLIDLVRLFTALC